MEIISKIVDSGAVATYALLCYKLLKEFPDIATKYIDLYIKIKKQRKL